MYVLYLDDAGSVGNASDRFIVLGGIAIFERQIHFLDKAMNDLAIQIDPLSPETLEFHASHILGGKGFWRSIHDKQKRRALMAKGLAQVDVLKGKRALFAAAVEKSAVSPEDAAEYAFEQLCSRFDQFLGRLHRSGNKQRGIIVLDKSTLETRLQNLMRSFRLNGHRWGKLMNLADVPFFVDSRATRAVQYADLVAHAVWRKYEKSDSSFFEIIETAFDAEGGVRHGLHIKTNDSNKKESSP